MLSILGSPLRSANLIDLTCKYTKLHLEIVPLLDRKHGIRLAIDRKSTHRETSFTMTPDRIPS